MNISGLALGGVEKISGLGLGSFRKISGLGLGTIWKALVDVTDNFNRANGSPGSNYTSTFTSGQAGITPVISSNTLRAGTTTTNNVNTGQGLLRNDAETTTDDQIISARVVSAANGLLAGLIGRAALDGSWGVLVSWNNATIGIQTRRNGVGDAGTRATASGNFLTTNDIVILEIIGNVFKVYRDRGGTVTTLLTWTDVGGTYYPGASTRRYAGVYLNSDRNIFGTQGWGTNLDDLRIRDAAA